MIADISHISDSFGYWFSGFVDGEGCFRIRKAFLKNKYVNYTPTFQIGLRADDKEILFLIKKILNFGNVQFKRVGKMEKKVHPGTKPAMAYHISQKDKCFFLTKLFEKYSLRTKKKNDFEIWKQFVIEKLKPTREQDIAFQEYCFKKIKEVRLYQKPNISLEKSVKIDRQLKLKTGTELKII